VPGFRKVLSRWANRYLSFSAPGDLSTLTGMVRAYDARFLKSLNLKAMDSEINEEIIFKAQMLGHGSWKSPPTWTGACRKRRARAASRA